MCSCNSLIEGNQPNTESSGLPDMFLWVLIIPLLSGKFFLVSFINKYTTEL